MKNNVAVKEKPVDLEVYAKKVDSYIQTFLAHDLNKEEVTQFREICTALKLDPFKREIHAVPYNTTVWKNGRKETVRQLSLIVGYEVYLRRADKTPSYDGHETKIIGKPNDPDFRCEITIFRTDLKHPIKHEVFFNEVCGRKSDGGLTKFWYKMPRFQLKKVAIAQGFRIAFPNDFDDLPYIKDEMEDEILSGGYKDITPPKQEKKKSTKKDTQVDEKVMKDIAERIEAEIINDSGIQIVEPDKKESNDLKVLENAHEKYTELLTMLKPFKDKMEKKDIEYFTRLGQMKNHLRFKTRVDFEMDQEKVKLIIEEINRQQGKS